MNILKNHNLLAVAMAVGLLATPALVFGAWDCSPRVLILTEDYEGEDVHIDYNEVVHQSKTCKQEHQSEIERFICKGHVARDKGTNTNQLFTPISTAADWDANKVRAVSVLSGDHLRSVEAMGPSQQLTNTFGTSANLASTPIDGLLFAKVGYTIAGATVDMVAVQIMANTRENIPGEWENQTDRGNAFRVEVELSGVDATATTAVIYQKPAPLVLTTHSQTGATRWLCMDPLTCGTTGAGRGLPTMIAMTGTLNPAGGGVKLVAEHEKIWDVFSHFIAMATEFKDNGAITTSTYLNDFYSTVAVGKEDKAITLPEAQQNDSHGTTTHKDPVLFEALEAVEAGVGYDLASQWHTPGVDCNWTVSASDGGITVVDGGTSGWVCNGSLLLKRTDSDEGGQDASGAFAKNVRIRAKMAVEAGGKVSAVLRVGPQVRLSLVLDEANDAVTLATINTNVWTVNNYDPGPVQSALCTYSSADQAYISQKDDSSLAIDACADVTDPTNNCPLYTVDISVGGDNVIARVSNEDGSIVVNLAIPDLLYPIVGTHGFGCSGACHFDEPSITIAGSLSDDSTHLVSLPDAGAPALPAVGPTFAPTSLKIMSPRMGTGGFEHGAVGAIGEQSGASYIGDIDNNGAKDIAVAVKTGVIDYGYAVMIYLMNSDGSVKTTHTIGETEIPSLKSTITSVEAIVALGDINGDGVPDLAFSNSGHGIQTAKVASWDIGTSAPQLLGQGSVGAPGASCTNTCTGTTENDCEDQTGCYWLSDSGTCAISNCYADGERTHLMTCTAGDWTVTETCVKELGDTCWESNYGNGCLPLYNGAVIIVMLNADGTVKDHVEWTGASGNVGNQTINGTNGPFFGDAFYQTCGSSLNILDDKLDDDGKPEILVGCNTEDTFAGTIYIVTLEPGGHAGKSRRYSLKPGLVETQGLLATEAEAAAYNAFGMRGISYGGTDANGNIRIVAASNAGNDDPPVVWTFAMIADGPQAGTVPGTALSSTLSSDHDRWAYAGNMAYLGDIDGPGDIDDPNSAYAMAFGDGGGSYKTNHCSNPQYTVQADCEAANGTWSTKRGGLFIAKFNDDGSLFATNPVKLNLGVDVLSFLGCSDPQHTSQSACDADVCRDSPQYTTEAACEDAGLWWSNWNIWFPAQTRFGFISPVAISTGENAKLLVVAPDDASRAPTTESWWLQGGDTGRLYETGAIRTVTVAADGSVSVPMANTTPPVPELQVQDTQPMPFWVRRFGYFGSGITNVGDRFGDGSDDIAFAVRGIQWFGGNGLLVQQTHSSAGLITKNQVGGNLIILNLDGNGDVVKCQNTTDKGCVAVGEPQLVRIADGLAGIPPGTIIDCLDTRQDPAIAASCEFGSSATVLGDIDGNGIDDLAVGANGWSKVGKVGAGSIFILLMGGANDDDPLEVKKVKRFHGYADADNWGLYPQPDCPGTDESSCEAKGGCYWTSATTTCAAIVQNYLRVAYNKTATAGGNSNFGGTLAAVDLNGDGQKEVLVGAYNDYIGPGSSGGGSPGALYTLFLGDQGGVERWTKAANWAGSHDSLDLDYYGRFGISIAVMDDLNGDCTPDLAVGAYHDSTGASKAGAVYILFMAPDGTVKYHQKIANGMGGLPAGTLDEKDYFGGSLLSHGNFHQDSDGIQELLVSASGDDDGLTDNGAFYLLRLERYHDATRGRISVRVKAGTLQKISASQGIGSGGFRDLGPHGAMLRTTVRHYDWFQASLFDPLGLSLGTFLTDGNGVPNRLILGASGFQYKNSGTLVKMDL